MGRLGATRSRALLRRALTGLSLGFASALLSCGYRPAYQATSSYAVVAGAMRTSQFEVTQAVLSGVRTELTAGSSAQRASDYPRVEVEILRVDERSIGIRRGDLNEAPLARGSEIVVVGRARVFDAPEAAPSFDTGDMSRAAPFASGTSPTADEAARSRAARDAARSLGRGLGRAVLGMPEPAEG